MGEEAARGCDGGAQFFRPRAQSAVVADDDVAAVVGAQPGEDALVGFADAREVDPHATAPAAVGNATGTAVIEQDDIVARYPSDTPTYILP